LEPVIGQEIARAVNIVFDLLECISLFIGFLVNREEIGHSALLVDDIRNGFIEGSAAETKREFTEKGAGLVRSSEVERFLKNQA
jgi:hypothetical protein